jgi:hypothetical protein
MLCLQGTWHAQFSSLSLTYLYKVRPLPTIHRFSPILPSNKNLYLDFRKLTGPVTVIVVESRYPHTNIISILMICFLEYLLIYILSIKQQHYNVGMKTYNLTPWRDLKSRSSVPEADALTTRLSSFTHCVGRWTVNMLQIMRRKETLTLQLFVWGKREIKALAQKYL